MKYLIEKKLDHFNMTGNPLEDIINEQTACPEKLKGKGFFILNFN